MIATYSLFLTSRKRDIKALREDDLAVDVDGTVALLGVHLVDV